MEENIIWEICQVMGAMTVVGAITVVGNKKQTTAKIFMPPEKPAVMFLEEYLDFANVFSKTNADIFLKHSMHDLAIEIEKGKIPPFGPVYNHLGVELQTLRDYVNKMLAKGFIIPSKSLSGAPILFTKKKIVVCVYA